MQDMDSEKISNLKQQKTNDFLGELKLMDQIAPAKHEPMQVTQ